MTTTTKPPIPVSNLFSMKEAERENHPLRLPAGTKNRIHTITKRLQAIDERMTFELPGTIEVFVERTLDRAEKELSKMEAAIKAKQDADGEDDAGDADPGSNDKPGNTRLGSGATSTEGTGGHGTKPTIADADA